MSTNTTRALQAALSKQLEADQAAIAKLQHLISHLENVDRHNSEGADSLIAEINSYRIAVSGEIASVKAELQNMLAELQGQPKVVNGDPAIEDANTVRLKQPRAS